MKIVEIVDGATQQVTALKNQAKQAQNRAKEAALRLKLSQTQPNPAKARQGRDPADSLKPMRWPQG